MEMLDILKERLPDGLSITKVYDRRGSNYVKIWFSFDGKEHVGWLSKVCAPGNAEKACDFTICTAMMGFALERNDLPAAKYWTDKQMELTSLV